MPGEPENQTKQGQVDGCSLAEAPPCPMLETEEDMGELTMADQISMHHRVHIRQEIVEHKPEKEEQDSVIRAMAKTTDDIDPSQSFHLWHPEYEKAERLQTEIMSAGGTKQKKDQQAARARREVERETGHAIHPSTTGLSGRFPRRNAGGRRGGDLEPDGQNVPIGEPGRDEAPPPHEAPGGKAYEHGTRSSPTRTRSRTSGRPTSASKLRGRRP